MNRVRFVNYFWVFASLFGLIVCTQVYGQTTLQGTVERIKVHGKGLEGNLEGDSPDRDVSIYLPPSYKKESKRRYPVVYFLHGFTDNDGQWYGVTKHWINLPTVVDKVFTSGQAQEMIIVTPNAYTRYRGSMYSNSVTTGNWEDFVAKELVSYIDQHYRTIPKAASRGLAGHSMGGYGTIRIGQKHPEIFSSLYLLSPCCMTANPNRTFTPELITKIEAIKTPDDVAKADFGTQAMFASAAAWSPNPTKSPFFIDLPIENGQPQPAVAAKWAANAPLAMIDQYIMNIKQLNALAFDAGNRDQSIAASNKVLDQILTSYQITHTYEEYEGDHINRIAERIEQKMLPFFSKHLSAKK
ncbi:MULTISPECIES: alpha/beta hydrolase-fold protein [unclassified Spirosoma]|uniref:alpha/beta hydrolase n=1 Tax=unclassified Spirosoma TaxID=2621999 RepID=UPI00096668D6|nr:MULTISPECIES: alpha/beta hydrolase-fold protein [unclassified Spirosoma]MBN8822586.1 esterase [Spirosoma sp.]OJW74080.1 MAG: esterase [Spirosoma sp. 48-14]